MRERFPRLLCQLRFLMAPAIMAAAPLVAAPAAVAQSTAAQQEFLFAYKLMQRGDVAEAGKAFDEYLRTFTQDENRGDATYFRAALHRKAGELRDAASLLDDAPTPKRVPAYAVDLLRGQVLTDLGRYDDALASLEKVDTDVLPDQAVASVLLLRGLAYRGAGNFEAAEKSAAQAAKLDSPVRARAMLEQARAQALGGDLPTAVTTLGKTLELNDAAVTPEAARYAGDLSYQLGNFDVAAGYYKQVIEGYQTSPEFAAAVVGRMWADLKADRSVAVVSAYKQFAESLPSDQHATAAYLAASAYQDLDQHALAAQLLTEYTAVGDDQPLQALALYKLAVSQFELTRFADMQKTVKHLEEKFPDSPQRMDAGFLYASAEAKQGHSAAGVARLQPFIDEGPENPYYLQALLRRAALYEQDGAPAAAADDLKQYLDDLGQPASAAPSVALRYADLCHRLGRFDEAIAMAELLLKAEPDPAVEQESLYRLGEAQTRDGQYEAALKTFDKLQADYPINPYRQAVQLRRGLLLNQLGRAEESTQVLIAAADDPQLPADQRVAALRIIAARMRDTGRPDDAALTLRRMETVGGLTALADNELLWLADYEVNRGEPEAALLVLDVFKRDDRKLAGAAESEALFTRGKANYMLGNLEDAHRAFFGVVALGRGFDLDARLYLARTEAAQGNYDAALIELSDLVNADDSAVRAKALFETGIVHRQRAELMRRRGEEGGAKQELLDARAPIKRMVVLYLTVDELGTLQERGLIELAEIAALLGDNDAMVKEYNELMRAFPDSDFSVYAKAVLDQTQRKRPDDALVLLNRIKDKTLDPALRQRVDAKVAELEAMR